MKILVVDDHPMFREGLASVLRQWPAVSRVLQASDGELALALVAGQPDLAAMIAYLRSVPPVRNAVTERSSYPFPLQPHPPAGTVPPPADNAVARGAYLAGPIAHCLDCHSGRLPNRQIDPARPGAQGLSFTGPWGTVVARNLTPHPVTGIGGWTEAQFARALREEVGGDGRPLMPPMGRGRVWAALTDRDVADLHAYFRSLPPLE